VKPALGLAPALRFFVVPGPDEAAQKALVTALHDAGHEVINDPFGALHAAPLAQAERNVFLATLDRMLEADALAADITHEGATAAWCVAWMLAKGRLCVLACRRDARANLSPMLAGNPSPWQRLVAYDAPADLATSLRALLA
jgi:hypothetical protein